jgi:hypothetical protein
MRPVREITAEEENFRVVPHPNSLNVRVIRRDSIEPEPVGTIVLCAFRIVGYDPDCDGSLMARMEEIDMNGETTGLNLKHHGLYPETELVVTLDELKALFAGVEPA